jgi:hypothetical protein
MRVYFGFIQSGFVSNHFCSIRVFPGGKRRRCVYPHTRDVMLSLSLSPLLSFYLCDDGLALTR